MQSDIESGNFVPIDREIDEVADTITNVSPMKCESEPKPPRYRMKPLFGKGPRKRGQNKKG